MARAVDAFKTAAIEKLRIEAVSAELARKTDLSRQREADAAAASALAQSTVVSGLAAGLKLLADGDLSYRISKPFALQYESLRADFNAASTQLSATLQAVIHNASTIRLGTDEIASAADDLSRRTEQQAASLEQTAAALDQITAIIKKTSEGAGHAKEVVGTARSDAQNSSIVVSQAVEAMSGIEASAQQISRIIGVIDEIAFQTNLLALNAGVEAARVGDSGRGFAVVASEVRALAHRSASAAKEIKALILTSNSQVKTGVELVGRAGAALDRISEQVTEVDKIVFDIATSATEQASGLAEVNIAVNQMDQMTQQTAAMVEQSTAATHNLALEAKGLAQMVGRFKVGQEDTRSIEHAA